MRSSVITEAGGVEGIEIQDRPRPDFGPEEVLIDVAASAVNHTDVWIRRGLEGDLPVVTGIDVAGTVAEVGEAVSDLDPGDRVVLYWNTTYCGTCEYCLAGEVSLCRDYGGLGVTEDGGHAEYVAVPATHAVPIPDDVSFETAAAFPSNFGTAWRALLVRGDLGPQEDALITGATGGVGHAAVQMAAHAGARVLASTSSTEHADRLRDLGADEVIDYTESDLDDAVRAATDGRGADLALDSVGGEAYERAVAGLARDGRLVTIGATTGDADAAMLQHLFWKQLRVIGATGCTLAEFRDAVGLLFDGDVVPVIDSVIGLSGIPDAHRRLEGGDVFGKIVVRPGD